MTFKVADKAARDDALQQALDAMHKAAESLPENERAIFVLFARLSLEHSENIAPHMEGLTREQAADFWAGYLANMVSVCVRLFGGKRTKEITFAALTKALEREPYLRGPGSVEA